MSASPRLNLTGQGGGGGGGEVGKTNGKRRGEGSNRKGRGEGTWENGEGTGIERRKDQEGMGDVRKGTNGKGWKSEVHS